MFVWLQHMPMRGSPTWGKNSTGPNVYRPEPAGLPHRLAPSGRRLPRQGSGFQEQLTENRILQPDVKDFDQAETLDRCS